MIRVVVDPGVFVSGAVTGSGSPTAMVLDLAERRQVELLVCPALIAELGGVLFRPKFRRWFTEQAAHDLLGRLTRLATMHPDPKDGVVRTRDPKDDYLLALAMETGAAAVVAGDRDLLEAEQDVVAVWTPRELIDRLG